MPTGIFDNRPFERFLAHLFTTGGRTNDFRKLRAKLYVIATELNSGYSVRFGEPGFDDVPISVAVQASSALPGLYPPVSIGGRHYVDGVLHKTLHASVALDAGAKLLFCVNPLVPLDYDRAIASGRVPRERLVDRGLTAVLSQTFRTLIRSRLYTGMAAYAKRYPDADIVLVEPRPDDAEIFFGNPFSFASRRRVAQHAYRATREFLAAEADRLRPVLERHGLRLNRRVLADPSRTFFKAVGFEAHHAHPAAALGHALDELERALREAGRG
jgi:predicted acylesterase/phospholipase RssA